MLGGLMGYLRKGSAMSAVAGLTFGGLLVGSGVMITQGESYKGHALASGVTGAMTLAMGARFFKTGKFMPAGMIATVGAVGLAYNAQKTREWMPEKEGKDCCFFSVPKNNKEKYSTVSPFTSNDVYCFFQQSKNLFLFYDKKSTNNEVLH